VTAALIPAAGSGLRLGSTGPKALIEVNGAPMLAWSVHAFSAVEAITSIAVAAPLDEMAAFEALRRDLAIEKWTALIPGGAERSDSVRALVDATEADRVLVHDAARPCITSEFVGALIDACGDAPAGIPALPVADTLKRGAEGRVVETVDRDGLFAVQTPQLFAADLLRRAHAAASGAPATDDAALVERLGETVRLLRGDADNLKVTFPEDVARASAILASRT
jgi:2-C-methyl-D-erythritol 4-phosphate cytidylyltransferase